MSDPREQGHRIACGKRAAGVNGAFTITGAGTILSSDAAVEYVTDTRHLRFSRGMDQRQMTGTALAVKPRASAHSTRSPEWAR